jgi:hypothetical protein
MQTSEKNFLTLSLQLFRSQRALADKALAQLADADIHWVPDAESNSIAVIVQHLHGNMLSRFTDFLTTDGEKPNRNRDEEFVEHTLTLNDLKRMMDEGWQCVFAAIEPLTERDLAHEVFIRAESHTVMEAILRQISHYAYHIGQIVYIAKHLRSENWQTLSIPKKRQ